MVEGMLVAQEILRCPVLLAIATLFIKVHRTP